MAGKVKRKLQQQQMCGPSVLTSLVMQALHFFKKKTGLYFVVQFFLVNRHVALIDPCILFFVTVGWNFQSHLLHIMISGVLYLVFTIIT